MADSLVSPEQERHAFMGLSSLGVQPTLCGKVREILDLGEDLLIVATDRISAFDHVMPNGIPGRGILLNRLSAFWLRELRSLLPNHFVSDAPSALPEGLHPHAATLNGRFMRVRKARRIPIECVVRGWLTGSGYGAYRREGSIGGVALPAGLAEFDPLPEPIFTPTTKADQGRDEPLTFDQVVGQIGGELAAELRRRSLEIYARGAAHAERRGIVIADTKFEFGWIDDHLALIDEVLTPDSSRFWPRSSVGPGQRPVSLDKQVLRDYLVQTGWDRASAPPTLPADVIAETSRRYTEVAARLLGEEARGAASARPAGAARREETE